MSDAVLDTVEISFALHDLRTTIAGEPMLSWFRLTEGVFDMRVGSNSIYDPPSGGVDYYVARLWEDLIRIEPFAVEPVPAPLVALISNPEKWRRTVDELMDRSPGQTRRGGALSWWTRRLLDSSYLADPPHLALVCVDSEIRIVTDAGHSARPMVVDALQFTAELSSFDRRLISTMASRLEEIKSNALVPFDAIEELQLDHDRRSRYRSTTLSHHIPTDWSSVLRALEELKVL